MNPSNEDSSKKTVDRRRFLQSLFGGLGTGTALEQDTAAEAKTDSHSRSETVHFFWTSLKTGQIGFPTGLLVPAGAPGSIMKLVSAAALHESGLYQGDETIECRGTVQFHNETYSCLLPHGKVNLTSAIGLSCNVFFATAAQHLSPRAYIDFAERFGLNTPVDGNKPLAFPAGKALHGDSARYALGLTDDLMPNALQILRIAAIVATKGHVPPMHNTGLSDTREEKNFGIVLKPSTWNILQQGMRMCGRQGTGKNLDVEDKLQLAVKTGTTPHGKAFQSWICGYFPYDSPTYAFCLRAPSGTSIERAVPAARKWLFSAQWI